MLVDVMTEKIKFTNTEDTLVGIDDYAMGVKSFKNSL